METEEKKEKWWDQNFRGTQAEIKEAQVKLWNAAPDRTWRACTDCNFCRCIEDCLGYYDPRLIERRERNENV